MKNIAILVYNVINDYYCEVIDGIITYFNTRDDIHAVIATVCAPEDTTSEFDYQYWSTVEIIKSDQIDGVVVVTNSFMDKISLEALSKGLSDFCNKPVLSVSTQIDVKNSKYTCTVPDESYEQVIEHFKNKHGRKRFAFFSASLLGSIESEQRFEAFKQALKKNDLELYPDLVFPGDFSPGTAREFIESKYKTKDEIDFDAIICVNDYTVAGCLLAFQKLKVNCPEEVSLIGFDNVPFCLITYPTISSIDQNIHETGEKVAELITKMVYGEEVEEKTVLQCSPIYRQSCGCVDHKTHTNAYYDAKGFYHEIDEKTKEREQNVILQNMNTTKNLYMLLNLMDTRITMKQLPVILPKALQLTNIRSATACFYTTSVSLGPTDQFVLPDCAKVLLHASAATHTIDIFSEENALTVNPHERLVPEEFSSKTSGLFFILPISLREVNYGYVICRINKEDVALTAVHLKILINILIHAYEYTKQEANKVKLLDRNHDLNVQSKTDELTKVFNRRGFIEYGERLVELSASMGKLGVVFFCDLDGLKKINDTYGHEIGDLAIKTEAKVLKAAFRDSDLVGRLSGDEFGVVAPGFPIRKVDVLRERLIELNKQLSEEAGLPFTLSISIGPIEYTEDEKDLMKLLTQADKNLYEEKKIKHAKK